LQEQIPQFDDSYNTPEGTYDQQTGPDASIEEAEKAVQGKKEQEPKPAEGGKAEPSDSITSAAEQYSKRLTDIQDRKTEAIEQAQESARQRRQVVGQDRGALMNRYQQGANNLNDPHAAQLYAANALTPDEMVAMNKDLKPHSGLYKWAGVLGNMGAALGGRFDAPDYANMLTEGEVRFLKDKKAAQDKYTAVQKEYAANQYHELQAIGSQITHTDNALAAIDRDEDRDLKQIETAANNEARQANSEWTRSIQQERLEQYKTNSAARNGDYTKKGFLAQQKSDYAKGKDAKKIQADYGKFLQSQMRIEQANLNNLTSILRQPPATEGEIAEAQARIAAIRENLAGALSSPAEGVAQELDKAPAAKGNAPKANTSAQQSYNDYLKAAGGKGSANGFIDYAKSKGISVDSLKATLQELRTKGVL